MRTTALALAMLPSLLLATAPPARAADARPSDRYLDESAAQWKKVARQIWELHETGLEEKKSAALLEDALEKEGFKVQRGFGALPTAFVATAGSGSPVIGILAEYDALPGLSQVAGEPKKTPIEVNAPGHGCGHNLLGTAAVSAGIAANRERIAQKLQGTIKVFGTPAEEPIVGKPFMIRDGAFNGVDVVLAWHPEPDNQVTNRTRLALSIMEVEFFGKGAHAAAAPWLGRSALDAVLLLDHAVALMREHNLPTARMHRAIKEGGVVPNVIPDHARVQWFLRDASFESLDGMVAWFRKAVDGAALGTETKSKITLLGQTRDPVPNDVLGKVVQRHLDRIGAPQWDEKDQEFAKALQQANGAKPLGMSTKVVPYGPKVGGTASSDIGEVSAVVPLAELNIATRPIGMPSHHWNVAATSAHSIGEKGMLVAAKILAASMADLLREPSTVQAARDEFGKTMAGKPFKSALSPEDKPVAWY